MSTLRPTRVGSDPEGQLPESLFELTVQIVHHPGLTPGEMLAVADEVSRRIGEAVDGSRFADLPLVRVAVDPGWVLQREQPLYPLTMGALRMTCRPDLVEAIERLCAGTDLARVAYDAAGRAYEVGVEVGFRRRPELDGAPDGGEGSGG